MALNLTPARTAVEAILFGTDADQCAIWRRPVDDVRFEHGQYLTPVGIAVYSGPCSIRAQITTLAGRAEQGAVSATQQRWTLSLPMLTTAADPPQPGDVVVVTVARDDALDGARFVVRDLGGGTNAVLRRMPVDRWVPGRGQDWMTPSP